MPYEVRSARMSDLKTIETLYAHARAFMAASGNPGQWGSTNPPTFRLLEDIARENLYVLTEKGAIHGVFALIPGEDPTYRSIENGAWNYDEPYATLHRVAGDGSGGILAAALAYAETNYRYLRIDTHEKNHPMRRAIARAGFSYCGIIHIADGTPRMAFDRRK